MFCANCGAALSSGEMFCSRCGARQAPWPQNFPPNMAYVPVAMIAAPVTDSSAIVSLVLGVLAIFGLHILAGIPAIIVGNSALKSIRASNGRSTGEGLARAGIIMGWVSVAIVGVVVLVLMVIGLGVMLNH